MTSDPWAIASAIGQVVAAFAAIVGLPFIGLQLSWARKTADLRALQEFVRCAQDHENKLLRATTSAEKDQAFFEFLNFLEMNAAALNKKLFPKTSRAIVSEKLRDTVVVIEALPEWRQKFLNAITTATTFSEIAIFMRREKDAIKAVAEARKKLALNESPKASSEPSAL